jgi:hypothetical protein
MSGFTPEVRIAGQDVDPITLAGATITYGAVSPDATADPGTAYLELVTLDALPSDAASWYPAVGYGTSIPSGFLDEYADVYAGPRVSTLTLGAPVTITARENVPPDPPENPRTNLCPNPTYGTGVTPWTTTSGTLTAVTAPAPGPAGDTCAEWSPAAGIHAVKVGVAGIPGGSPITFSAYVYVVPGSVVTAFDFYGFWKRADGSFIPTAVDGPQLPPPAAGGWARLSHTITAPLDAAAFDLEVRAFGLAAGARIMLDAVLIEAADTPGPYFDGGYADPAIVNPVTAWTGTPHASPSTVYSAPYRAHVSTRFTGTVAAIDYRPASIAVTAVDACEPWTRALVIPAAWPREPERDRVNRIAAAAGLALDVVGDSTATVGPGPTSDTPVPAWTLLARVAADCGAVLYATRTGIVTYRTRAASTGRAVVDAYPAAVLIDPLTMTQEAAALVNVARVTHPDDTTGQGTTIVVEDPDSKARYGHRERSWSVELDATSAAAFADRQIANRKAPAWAMPSMRLMLGLAADAGGDYPANVVALLDADLDDEVSLVGLLPSSPVPSYRSRILGVVETLVADDWTLDYYLDPLGWSQTAPGDAYVPPPPLAPSKDPQLEPGERAGDFRVRNYDGNLTYVVAPLAGTTGTAVLDTARGVFTVDTSPAAWSVATTEPGSTPGYMERKPYTYTTVDRGRWETTTRTRDESYPARSETRDVLGDPATGPNQDQCPVGWYPVYVSSEGRNRCQTQVTEWRCDYGGTLEGTICRKVVTYTETVWVPNPVTERDPTPAGYVDTGTEWVRTR